MKLATLTTTTLAFTLFWLHLSEARGDIVYAVENGPAGDDIGFGSPPTAPNLGILFNQFNTVPGFERITAVQVSWGDVFSGNGRAAFVAVWSDPNGDGNPDDAVLLSSAPVTTQNAGSGVFVECTLPAVNVHGSFFAGVGFADTDSVSVGNGVASVPVGRSWGRGFQPGRRSFRRQPEQPHDRPFDDSCGRHGRLSKPNDNNRSVVPHRR